MNGQMLMSGKEIRLPICKSLSRDERNYLNILNNGIDKNVQSSVNWLKTPQSKKLLRVDDYEEFKENFFDTDLYYELENNFNDNVDRGVLPLTNFYDVGRKLAYKDLNRRLPFSNADESALNILNIYVGDVIENVNQEFGLGIIDTLFNGALMGLSITMLSEELIKLPYTPIRSNVSVSTRCNMIAVTEYGRAINTGTLQAYSNVGVTEVDILTTGLPNVCDDCIDLEDNNPYTLEEAMRILPLHPRCACSYQPVKSSIDNNAEIVIVDLTK